MNQELSHELELVMRSYLKYLLEREVKSVTWLDTLKGQMKQAEPGQEATSDKADKQSPNHMSLLSNKDNLY